MQYKAWGETRSSTGDTPTDYQYTGQRNESGIGLYYYNARWYDASLSRDTCGQVEETERSDGGKNPFLLYCCSRKHKTPPYPGDVAVFCVALSTESGRWDSNPRYLAWKASVLPLNYARKVE
jgi:RHS repeat-associated protein